MASPTLLPAHEKGPARRRQFCDALQQHAQLPPAGGQGLGRADRKAAAAAVAHFSKKDRLAAQHGYGPEAADLPTGPAGRAAGGIHLWHLHVDRFGRGELRLEVEVQIGASTSASTARHGLPHWVSRLAATVVLPAPPLPLATSGACQALPPAARLGPCAWAALPLS